MPVVVGVGPNHKALYDGKTIKEWLYLVVSDIVSSLDPVQVFIFGSAMQDKDGPDSDLDILVVFDRIDDDQVLPLMIKARSSITAPIPCDVLVTDLARFAFNKQRLWHIEHEIAKTGLMVYERAARIAKDLYMNPPPPDDKADADMFLERAKNDLIIAEMIKESGDRNNIGYHSQQAAEKAIKALLITLKIEPPRTHELVALIDRLPERYSTLFDKPALESLAPWAIVGRYPGDIPDIANKSIDTLLSAGSSVLNLSTFLMNEISGQQDPDLPAKGPEPKIG